MSDFGSIISELLSRFPSLFKIFLKKIYKLEVVKNRTIVDLASNESAVKLQLSDNGEVQIMVRIANYTPFDLKAQNMTFDIVWYGLNKKLRQTNYEIISKHSERTIFIREELSRDNIDKIREIKSILDQWAEDKNMIISF